MGRKLEAETVTLLERSLWELFRLSPKDWKLKRQTSSGQQARYVGMYVLRHATRSPLKEIGSLFGVSHTAVADAYRTIEGHISDGRDLRWDDECGNPVILPAADVVNRVSTHLVGRPTVRAAGRTPFKRFKLAQPSVEFVDSKLPPLQALTRGFERGSVTVMAAPVRTGKTTIAVQMLNRTTCDEANGDPVPALFFSLRSRYETVMAMVVADMAGVRTVAAIEPAVDQSSQKLIDKVIRHHEDREIPLWIVDAADEPLSVSDLETWCVKCARDEKVRLIVIDDLEHFRPAPPVGNDGIGDGAVESNEWLGLLVRRLQRIARSHNVAILALSTLRPAADLANPASIPEEIQANADVVLTLSREMTTTAAPQKCVLRRVKGMYGLEAKESTFAYDPKSGRFMFESDWPVALNGGVAGEVGARAGGDPPPISERTLGGAGHAVPDESRTDPSEVYEGPVI